MRIGRRAGQCVERRHGNDPRSVRHRQSLDGRDPDAKACERSGPGCDSEQIDIADGHSRGRAARISSPGSR